MTSPAATTATLPAATADLRALSQLLDRALKLPTNQVDAWLAALPESTRHVAPHLRRLMQQHRTGACAGFLASSPRLDDIPTAASIQPGHRAGPYRLLREIGRGGMCSVWLAEWAQPGRSPARAAGRARQVAIKLPHRPLCADTASRLARERDITALMDHPQVARLHDAGCDADHDASHSADHSAGPSADQPPYLVLDWVRGLPLDQWCKRHQPGIDRRLRLAVQLARALAHVHGRGVVHRDLKPANVMVDSRGQVRLLDFGIAQRLPAAQQPGDAASTELSFTPAYASPEQRRGEPAAVASDIYSLGALLFELFTGQLPCDRQCPRSPHSPHSADNPQSRRPPNSPQDRREPGGRWLALVHPADHRHPAPLASSRAADAATAARLHGAIDAVLHQALAPLPAQRHASATALADALQACLRSGARPLGGGCLIDIQPDIRPDIQADSPGQRRAKPTRRRAPAAAGVAARAASTRGLGQSRGRPLGTPCPVGPCPAV